MEEGCVTSFIDIDLLAAFDTFSQDILLDLLEVLQLLASSCPKYTGDDSSHFTGPG